ncbi:MAG: hypothetical protein J0I57_12340, partial [Hyphomicrobium sp.]|nr:hypothetical protein [Hyphomicrobium sp.]
MHSARHVVSRRVVACAAMLAALFSTAQAQDYPTRPIEMVVTWGPGGGADQTGRMIGKLLEPELKVSIPVENVAGSSGVTGLNKLLSGQPEGYQLGLVTADTLSLLAAPRAQRWSLNDLAIVAVLIKQPSGFFVQEGGAFKSWADVEAKAKTTELKVGVTGLGTPDELAVEQLKKHRGLKLIAVPFAKPSERYASVLGGHADLVYEQAGDVRSFIDNKQLRPVLFLANEKVEPFTDIPITKDLGMNLVLVADDAFTFLVAWEFMSLSSWALVLAHHHDRENARAGYIYILMASFGTFALLLAFGLLAGPSGQYAFGDIRGMTHAGWLEGLVLVLALVGAGSKAGLVPLHVWLPLAHPAAPSHVSALMSGVMTKVAIYGFIRIVFDLLGPPSWWWSLPVLGLASATAVLGVLYALMQRDLKRLLAYSTVENVGIVFIGLGLALAFMANNMAGPAALAFTAALFHAFNHSLFKSLMFFGAGAVLTATGARDIEKLGGLILRMPQTAFVFLGGVLAISALPPLNGFVSEWLMFQAVLLSPDLPQWGLKLSVPAVGAMLALAAALSAACFVRAFGIAFLGRPRTPEAAEAAEVDTASRASMFVLLALCLIAGVLPGLLIDAIAPTVAGQIGQSMPAQS